MARHRVEAGEVEAAIFVRLLQRFVSPVVGGVAFEQRRAHAEVRLAGHEVGRPARAEHLLQALADAAGEKIGRGMAVAELQDRQAMGGEKLGRQFAVGGKLVPRAIGGGQGRLQRGGRAQAARAARRRQVDRRRGEHGDAQQFFGRARRGVGQIQPLR